MIINGNSTKGIFIYNIGIAVEVGDFLIHEDNIYLVTDSRYDGSVSPDTSIYCKLYVDTLPNIITTDKCNIVINSIIKGLGLNGSIATIQLNDLVDLDEYKTTSIYNIVINSENYLLRTYLINDKVVQELINYNIPTFSYRIYEDKNWSSWKALVSVSDDNKLKKFNESLGKLLLEVNKTRNINNLVRTNNSYMYCKRLRPDVYGRYWTSDEKELLLNLIVRYQKDDQYYQTNVIVDPNAVNDDNEAIIPATTKSGHEIRIISTPNYHDKTRGYSFSSSEPIELLAVLAINKY